MADESEPPRKRAISFNIEGFAPTVTVFGRLPDDHPFYTMVGRVASAWAHLEHTLDIVIWELTSSGASKLSNQRLACITSQIMGVPGRCNAIIMLAGLHGLDDKSIQRPFRQLMSDSHDVAKWRARWIHDPWYTDTGSPGAPAQFRAMPPVDPRFGIQEIEQTELSQTLDRIAELQDRAGKLRGVVLAALSASN